MERLRKGLPLLLLILFMLGGCGRMSGKNLENEILGYLRDKHGEEFRLLRLTEENSGYEGHFLRAVCRSESIEDPFTLIVYEDLSFGEETAEIDGRTVGVRDEYPNVRLQREYARLLREMLPEAVFIGCTVETTGRCYTAEEVDRGVEACAQIAEADATVTAYVIADAPDGTDTLFPRVESALSALPFFRQYLYFGRSLRDEDYWKEQFAENYDRFDYHFMRSGLVADPVTFKIQAD